MSARAATGALLAVLAAGLAVTPARAPAAEKPPVTREQALSDIAGQDVEARRQAAAWLGDLGVMADAPVLLRALRDPDEVVRGLAEHSVWQVWSRSGDPHVDALFEIGVSQMNQGAPDAAVDTFTAIIARKPDFAEGWNKRATVYFLMGQFDKSLHDCDEVVKRNPEHFGVLAGYGQIYLQLDQPERALDYFQRALKVNPNMRQVEVVVEQLRQLIAEKRKGTI